MSQKKGSFSHPKNKGRNYGASPWCVQQVAPSQTCLEGLGFDLEGAGEGAGRLRFRVWRNLRCAHVTLNDSARSIQALRVVPTPLTLLRFSPHGTKAFLPCLFFYACSPGKPSDLDRWAHFSSYLTGIRLFWMKPVSEPLVLAQSWTLFPSLFCCSPNSSRVFAALLRSRCSLGERKL